MHRLDPLLDQLRHSGLPRGLDDIESRVWQRIAERDDRAQLPRLRLSFQIASVAGAFLIGMLFGVDVGHPTETAQAFLIEEVNLLPRDLGSHPF